MRVSGLLIAFLLFLPSCKKDYESAYALIQTGEVTDINKEGAVFNAKIINLSNEDILEYGFVWDTIAGANIERSERLMMTEPAKNGVFNQQITTDLKPEARYFVKAYIKNFHYITYGKEVVFKSFGNTSPGIIRVWELNLSN